MNVYKLRRKKKKEAKKLCIRTFFGLGICCSFSLHRRCEFFLSLHLFSFSRHSRGFYFGNIVIFTFSLLFFFFYSMENLPRVCFYDILWMCAVHVLLTFLQILSLLSKKKVHKSIPYLVPLRMDGFLSLHQHSLTHSLTKLLLDSGGFFPSACFLMFRSFFQLIALARIWLTSTLYFHMLLLLLFYYYTFLLRCHHIIFN